MSLKSYEKRSVLDAALDRVRWLFDEFAHVVVNVSGGKDSTVCLNLALQVAEEKGRLPLPVMFLDQEAEWQSVIDHIREIMHDPRVEPHWLQIPFKITNAASAGDPWLHAWEPGREWVREKEPDSIHENTFGTDRFAKLFSAYLKHEWPGEPAVQIAGVRAEESPARLKGLTSYLTYKGETWGKIDDKARGHYTMYPIYDWSYTDVWKAIHAHGWPYCRLYDVMHQYGVPVMKMRVSNLTHETALKSLHFLQEVEGETWDRVASRLPGINTVGHLREDFHTPKELPWMFKDWAEYRDHLLENLVTDPAKQAKLRSLFAKTDATYVEEAWPRLRAVQIAIILANDFYRSKIHTFAASNGLYSRKAGSKGGKRPLARPAFIVRTCAGREHLMPYLREHGPADMVECFDDTGQGGMGNFLKALRLAGDGPAVHMEDDIVLTQDFDRKALDVIARHPKEVVQFFSMRQADLTKGSRYEPGARFRMNQCFYLPAGMGTAILKGWGRLSDERRRIYGPDYDVLMADFFKAWKLRYWLSVPSLVDHRVGKSVIDPRRASTNRQSLTFTEPIAEEEAA